MADVVLLLVTVAFFALCAALVVGCNRIVRSDQDDTPTPSTEVTA